jgi:hypothetical protein
VKINYERRKLNVCDVSIDLFMKIMQTIEEHTRNDQRERKAEEWRALAMEPETAKWQEAS